MVTKVPIYTTHIIQFHVLKPVHDLHIIPGLNLSVVGSSEFLAIRPGPLQIGGHKGGTAEPLQTVIRVQIRSGSCFLLVSGFLSASRLVKRQHSSGAFIQLLTNSADILEDPYETFQWEREWEGEGEKERKGNAKLGGDGVKKKSARIWKGKANERIRGVEIH